MIRDRTIREERAFEMSDRRLGDVGEPWRQLLDAAVGELGEVVDRACE